MYLWGAAVDTNFGCSPGRPLSRQEKNLKKPVAHSCEQCEVCGMHEFCNIGRELIETAKTDFSARGVLTPLFPYIHEAAKSMSARAISRWLLRTHQVKVSDVTLSKALRNPEKHWEAFADYIEPWARTVENSIEAGMECFLFREEVFDHLITKPEFVANDGEDALRVKGDFQDAVEFLRENWFSLDLRIRENCERYFQVATQAEDPGEE